jgi:prevent-host-death family protein
MYIYMYMKARRYSIARARAELPTLLRSVEKGGVEVEISRRGVPVAVILSVAARARLSARKSFAEAFDAFVAKNPLPKLERNYFARLRSRSPGRKVKL